MPRLDVHFADSESSSPIDLDEIPQVGDLVHYGGTTYQVDSRLFLAGGGTRINVSPAKEPSKTMQAL